MNWRKFSASQGWRDLFPYPAEYQPALRPLNPITSLTLSEVKRYQKLSRLTPFRPSTNWHVWDQYAERYFLILHIRLQKTYNTAFRFVVLRLRQHENHLKCQIGLDPDVLTKYWLDSLGDGTVADIYRAIVYEKRVNELVDKEIERTRHRWVLPPAPTSNTKGDGLPHIRVMPDARASLADALRPYVDPAQHAALSNLIHYDTSPEQPILCQCEQVCLAAIFYQQVKAFKRNEWGIQANKTNIARWLCHHFRRIDNGEEKTLSYSTLLKHLSGKDLGDYQ